MNPSQASGTGVTTGGRRRDHYRTFNDTVYSSAYGAELKAESTPWFSRMSGFDDDAPRYLRGDTEARASARHL